MATKKFKPIIKNIWVDVALFTFAIICIVKMIFEGEETTTAMFAIKGVVLGIILGFSIEDALIRFIPLKVLWNDDKDVE